MSSFGRTGCTFRMLLRALTAASSGKRVAVRAWTSEYARELCVTASRMARGYTQETGVNFITFAGGGSIIFLGARQRYDTELLTVLTDHYKGR